MSHSALDTLILESVATKYSDYLLSSGAENKLKEQFGSKTFAEIRAEKGDVREALDQLIDTNVISSQQSIKASGSERVSFKPVLGIINESMFNEEYNSEQNIFAEKTPVFFALNKALDCLAYDYNQYSIEWNESVNELNHPYLNAMLDCLELAPSKYDAEIKAYHLNLLAQIQDNAPQALTTQQLHRFGDSADGIKELLKELSTVEHSEL